MTRPTREEWNTAATHLEDLVWRYDSQNNPNGWPDVALLLHLLAWFDGEYARAKADAAYGPGSEQSPEGGGTIGTNTIGRHGLGRPVEQRFDWGTDHEDPTNHRPRLRPELRDRYVRDLAQLRAEWRSQLGPLFDHMRDRAKEVGRWPVRSEETG